MFNLLPSQEKMNAKAEYNRRRFAVALSLLGVTLFIAIIFIAPSHVVTYFKYSDIFQTSEILKNNIAIKNKEDLNSLIVSANMKIATLLAETEMKPTDLLSGVVAHRSPEIRLTAFTVGLREKDKKVAISVSGVAANREALLAFLQSIKSDPLYEQADLPISNFTRDKDINFSMTIIKK